MQARTYRRWLTVAALAIAPVFASHSVYGQYSSSNDGHALDANNGVGSGGYNGPGRSGSQITGNDIVYGNVTGGKGLTGRLREFDPQAFRGTLAGSGVDQFIAGSSGAPTPSSPNFSLSTPRAYYANSRGVAPPSGSVLIGSTGSAIGTSLTPDNPYSSPATSNQLSGVRLGSTNIIGVPGGTSNGLLELPGGLDSSNPNIQSTLSASPLYGIRSSGAASSAALNSYLNNPTPGQLAPNSIDQNQVNALRQQLQTSQSQTPGGSQLNQNLDGTTNLNADSANGGAIAPAANPFNPSSGNPLLNPGKGRGNLSGGVPLQMPLNSPVNGSNSGRLGDSVTNTPLGSFSESPRGIQLTSPSAYSSQYAAMQQELKQYNVPSAKPTVSRKAAAVKQPGKSAQTPGTPGTPATPGAPATPGTPGTGTPAAGATPAAVNPEPVKVSSIAATITSPRAKGLHDLLAKAEDSLKNDRFKAAIEQFDSAITVAPNNQMIALGRGNAALAAGYYAAAETSIRRAVGADATVLMAQLDLSSMLSSGRLDFLRKDLKELADKNSKESRPWFLLAYVAYNTGDAKTAANDLQEAKNRSVPNDAAILLMQEYWQLPKSDVAQPSTELNK